METKECIRCKKQHTDTTKTCSVCISKVKLRTQEKKLLEEIFKDPLPTDLELCRLKEEYKGGDESPSPSDLKSFKNEDLIVRKESIDFVHPFSLKLVGSRGSGKTTFMINYLNCCFKNFNKIIWISTSFGQELMKHLKCIEKVNFLDPSERNIKSILEDQMESKTKTLIIMDDCMVEMRNNKNVLMLFVRGRHLNVSICTMEQHLHYSSNVERINTDYYLLFKIRDAESLERFRKKYCCEIDLKSLIKMGEHCEKSNMPLMINLNGKDKFKSNFNVRLEINSFGIEENLIEKVESKVEIVKDKGKSNSIIWYILGNICG